MSGSPHRGTTPWVEYDAPADDASSADLPEIEFDLLVDESAALPTAEAAPADEQVAHSFDDDVYETRAPSTSTDYASAPGMPGRGVIVMSSAAALGCAGLDFAFTGGLSIFFDLCYVTICLVGVTAVRRRDLFTAGVLAPLVYGGVIAVVALVSPDAFAAHGGLTKVFMSGLTEHAGALVAGYGVALAAVAARVSASRPAP